MAPVVDFAILHHPVVNRVGEEIAAQIDEFDFFDACRLSLAYPIRHMYVVNPLESQRAMARRLIAHGGDPARRAEGREVFDRTVEVADLAAALADAQTHGPAPKLVATSAVRVPGCVTFASLRDRIRTGEPFMVVFGKAWGLAPSVLEGADLRLEPVDGGTDFNHLSVRSAMSIVLDRLLAGLA